MNCNQLDRKEILKKYLHVVDVITEACDWKSSFDPEEIVDIICAIIEGKDVEIVKVYEDYINDVNSAVAKEMERYNKLTDQSDYYGLETTSIPR